MDLTLADDLGSSISDIAQKCRDAFDACLALPALMEQEWAENRLADFNLWASGSGAFAKEKASLDSRLTMDYDAKNLVVNLLITLLFCVGKCQKHGNEDFVRFLFTS